jgi:catechol 2,3-dioxygenase-like lactoylglutathione lyase family enzyme
MRDPNYTLLYVNDPAASTAFYTDLLGRQPIESSPDFALFALESGLMLGLWSRHAAEPAASITGGGGELAFQVGSDAEVDAVCADWRARGLAIAQKPTRMDFGYTCVAADLDGHRLRAFSPAQP